MNTRPARIQRLRRRTTILIVAVLSILVAAPTQAAQARHLRIEIHDSFTDPFLTEACGVDVVVSFDASLNITLVYNSDGLIVREIDPSGGGRITIGSPETGEAFSSPFQNVVLDYGDGARIGSAFEAMVVGLSGHVPGGIDSDAGRTVFGGLVKGFDDNDTPLLDFTHLISVHGNVNGPEEVIPAICAALTAA